MPAHRMPKRRPSLPLPLPLLLGQEQGLGLGLGLLLLLLVADCQSAKASGNDAISVAAASAAAGHRHIQSEASSLILMKRDASSEELDATAHGQQRQQRLSPDLDFSAYVNDFNLQAEASIPEDIFDQHNGDIDEDAATQLQYAEPADDEADESEAADIILESQRPTSRNFSVYLAKDGKSAKKHHNNNYSGGSGNSNNSNNKKNLYNYKLKNNKESMLPKRVANEEEAATKSTSGGDDNVKGNMNKNRNGSSNNDKVDMERNGNGNGYDDDEDTDGEDIAEDNEEDEKPNANFDSKSLAYKKFKNMHEQQNQQSQKEQQQQQQQRQQRQQQANTNGPGRQLELPGDGQQWQREPQKPVVEQLFDSIEILNERKFNKASSQSTLQADPEPEPDIERVAEKEIDDAENVAGEDIMAIGDIEDNFGNDKVLAENIKSTIDNDESAAKEMANPVTSAPTTTTRTTTARTTTTTTKTTLPTTRASAPSTTTTTTTTGPATSSQRDLTLIGHKQKRHGNSHSGAGAGAWAGDRYYEKSNYGVGRLQPHHGTHEPNLELGELHYYDGGQDGQEDGEDSAGKSEANYLSSYLGHTMNGSKPQHQHQHQHQQQQQRQMQDSRFHDDDEYGRTRRTEQLELESTMRYHPDATTSSPSAFERFKALRRNSRRNGHKSHKKRYKDYLKHSASLTPKYALKVRKDREQREREWQLKREQQQEQVREWEMEKEKDRDRDRNRERDRDRVEERQWEQDAGHAHAAPIFALGVRPQRVTPKPFYEGQVNYYEDHQEAQQPQQLDTHHTEMERLIATDNGNWYRRISPVLRNGIKASSELQPHQSKHHHHLKHHYHQHHSHHKHARQHPPNPYQRKSPAQITTPPTTPEPPLPPPKQQLGHQITELEQLERYYAKWPHLARVQFQVYDEHYREAHPELYADYDTDDDYETAAELEEAQQDHGEEANLPPYIKKYNRRNKQLLNLLEGTLSPPTPTPFAGVWSGSQLQPGPHESAPIRLDDEYLKQKRRRYQQRYEDLFAQQHRSSSSGSSISTSNSASNVGSSTTTPATQTNSPASQQNQLPEEDKQLDEHQLSAAVDFWQKQIETKAMAAPVQSTPKPALFKLPLYPAITSSFLGTPRSRSAQFVANVSGRGQSSWHAGPAPAAEGVHSTGSSSSSSTGSSSPAPAPPSSPLNSFVYHRVVDGIGSAGSSLSSSSPSRKQRLPFVAITDRRLENVGAHKLLGEHKDFEQNHFPMP